MKTTFFFQLLLNLFFGVVLFIVGACLAIYPLTKSYYEPLSQLIETTPWLTSLVGISLAFIAFSILSWIFPLFRKGHFETIKGKTTIWVEDGLIQKTVQKFLQQKFPEENISSCSVVISKNRIQILCELPKNGSLKELENELQNELQKTLGYTGPIHLSAIHK